MRSVSSLLTVAAALNRSVNPFSSPYIPDVPNVNEVPPPGLVCTAAVFGCDAGLCALVNACPVMA